MRRNKPKMRLFSLRFSGISLVLLILFVAGLAIRVQAGDGNNNVTENHESARGIAGSSSSSQRPTIYTYFQRIDANNRTTGMTNDEDDDLLSFWKERWEAAGYTPVILTSDTVYSPSFENQNESINQSDLSSITKERYESVRTKLDAMPLDDFGKILFRRWLAMAAIGGGWFSDYDNFPLWNLDNEGSMSRDELHLPTKMTVYDILSPTLASGSGIEWLETLEALLDDTIQNCPPRSNCFYSDSLAIHSLKSNHHTMAPKTGRKVALPFENDDRISFNDPDLCSKRAFRKFTVHFSPEALQRGKNVPPKDRHPKHRSRLARGWLDRWQELCHKKTIATETTEESI